MAASKIDNELYSLISEYLRMKGLSQTLTTFSDELKQPKLSTVVGSGPSSSSEVHSEFIMAFECGECQTFFHLWEEHIPQRVRQSDPTAQHLECNTSAYFAVYPIRTGAGNKEKAMAEFRAFLENRGAELAQSQELASLFALPYVPDPANHPSFKNLFLDSWIMELKARLIQFLEHTLPSSAADTPRLIKLYLESKKADGILLQEDCVERLSELQNSYHTLVGISMELVGVLESAVAGRSITPEYIQSICSRLFQSSNAQKQSTEPPKPSTSSSLLRASVISLRQSLQVPEDDSMNEIQLDFTKIKAELVGHASDSSKAVLVQALRWRLTRSLPGSQRDSILSAYLSKDLLGCSSPNSSYQAAVAQVLTTTDPHLREQLARLFNTLASLAGGRGYMSQAIPIVKALLYLMYGENREDSYTRKHCLGALQKLSLRHSIVRMMIKNSVVQFIANTLLLQPASVSDYTVRYSLALLLNVCLRCIGRTHCIPHSEALLAVLGEFLEHEDQEICSYVNGALYSLLSSPSIRDIARRMGIDEMLQSALRASPPDLRGQIDYIIMQMNSNSVEPDDSGDEGGGDQEEEEDEEDDPDMIEGDEEEITIFTSGPTGDTLLNESFSLDPSSVRQFTIHSATGSAGADKNSRDLNDTYSEANKFIGQSQNIEDNVSSAPFIKRYDGQQTIDITERDDGPVTPYARPVTPQSFRPHTTTITGMHLPSHDFSSSYSKPRRPTTSTY